MSSKRFTSSGNAFWGWGVGTDLFFVQKQQIYCWSFHCPDSYWYKIKQNQKKEKEKKTSKIFSLFLNTGFSLDL